MKRFGVNRWAFRGVLIGLVAAAACAAAMVSVSQAATCDETWAGPGGTTSSPTSGLYGTASNWSPASVPTGSQNVCLNSGSYTVTVSGGTQNAGTLTVGSGATVTIAAGGGSGADLTLGLAGSTNSGMIELTDSDSSGTANQTAQLLLSTGATLTNDGTILSDPGPLGLGTRNIYMQSLSSTLTNSSSGTITVNQDLLINNGSQSGQFVTSGTVTIAAGKKFLVDASGGAIGGNPATQQTGMTIDGGTITDNGTFGLGFSESGAAGVAGLTVNGGTITGAGLMTVAGNTASTTGTAIGAAFSGTGSGTFTFVGCSCASATTLGGTIGANDTVVFSGSTADGSANAQVNSNMTNNGTIELTDSDASGTSANAADLQIGTGATLTNDGTILSDPGPAGVGQRIINGQSANSTLDNASSGHITVNQPLQIDATGQGTFTNSGPIGVPSGQTLQVSPNGGATFNLDAGTITNNGTAEMGVNSSGNSVGGNTFNVNGGTITGHSFIAALATTTFSGAGSGAFTLAGATSIFGGGTIAGTISSNDNVTLSANSSGTGSAAVSSSGTVVNDGTFTLTDTDTSASGGVFAELEVPSGSSFTNNGTMVSAPGPAGSGYRSIDGTLTNAGTLNVDMLLQLALHATSGIDNSGTVNISSGQAYQQGLMITGGSGTYSQTGGTTTLMGAGAALTAPGVIINGGTLSGSGTICGPGGSQSNPCGSGSSTTDLSNAGTVKPSPSPATLTLDGNYTQSSAGTLDAQVTSTGVDQLAVTGGGTAALDGTLAVSTASGFTPTTGHAYQILTAPGGVSGTFATTTGLGSGPYTVTYNPTNVTLTAVLSAARVSFHPGTITFGSPSDTIAAGATVHQTLTVTDSGTASLTLGTLSLTGTDVSSYSLSSDNCSGKTIAAGDSCTASVGFSPASAGTYSAAVSVPDNATGSPQQVSLTGNAGAAGPRVTLSQSSLDFGVLGVGHTETRSLTLTNTGSRSLQVTSSTVSGTSASDYEVTSDSCAGKSVGSGSSCTVGVSFTAGAAGARNAHLSITDDAPDSPQTAALTGTGTTTGSLSGRVVNGAITSSPPPLSGASIQLCGYGSNPAGCEGATTNAAGDYGFSSLAPGSYHIELFPPKSYLAPAAAVVSVVAGPNVQNFILRPPLPIATGVSINGQTSGNPASFYKSPATIDAEMKVPQGTAGTTGALVTDFWATPAGAVLRQPLAFGRLVIDYRYDSSGVARLVSITTASSWPASPIGSWSTGLSSAPVVGEAVASMQAQGVFMPSLSSPLHGNIEIIIRQYSVPTTSAAPDERTADSSAPCLGGTWATENDGGVISIDLPNGDQWFPATHTLLRGYDGSSLSLGSDVNGEQMGVTDQDGGFPDVSYSGPNSNGDWQTLFDASQFASTGNFNPDLPNVYPDGEIPSLDVRVNPDGSIVDLSPGDHSGEYQFNPNGTITDTVTGAVIDSNGNIINCPKAKPPYPPFPPAPPPNSIDDLYEDPSGAVSTPTHVPVADAKVVLLHSAHHAGPFAAVPNGSIIMSPSNRRNPDHTTQLGLFGWDVFPGFYEVTAQHTRCKGAHGGKLTRTKALTVPPAVVGLNLTLRCPRLHRHKSRLKLTARKVPVSEVVLVATVRGRHRPQGVVTFRHGRRKLGVVPVSRAGRAVFTTTGTITTGFRARYGGDGYNAPSSGRG